MMLCVWMAAAHEEVAVSADGFDDLWLLDVQKHFQDFFFFFETALCKWLKDELKE